jgi:hypothetical protein
MKIPGLACTVVVMLGSSACRPDRIVAPTLAPTAVHDGGSREVRPPLFVVDGRVVDEGDGTGIDPAGILDVKVLRGEQAVPTYGARGVHGAVLIATRPAEAGAGGPLAGCWLANGCADVALPPPPRPAAAPAPGAGDRIRLRSCSSLRQGQPPLFVVDGRVCGRGACGVVSLGDITRVWVWIGVSASAVYGSAAASGIVVLDTRHAGEEWVRWSEKMRVEMSHASPLQAGAADERRDPARTPP